MNASTRRSWAAGYDAILGRKPRPERRILEYCGRSLTISACCCQDKQEIGAYHHEAGLCVGIVAPPSTTTSPRLIH